MRREWSGWIKTRQWSEFEKLAKTDPSQALADTVAELERGFPDKPDRRALRKVLFLLSQAGYQPTEIEEGDQLQESEAPFTVAFMVSPDGQGETVFAVGREEKTRVAWLIIHLRSRGGVTRAIEDTTTTDEAQPRLMRLRNMAPYPCISAQIPYDYALSRLAQAVSTTAKLPSVMAYWRAILPKEFLAVHPADGLPRGAQTLSRLRDVAMQLETTATWHLELGALSPALSGIFERHKEELDQESGRDPEWWDRTLEPYRGELFTEAVVEDHVTRLLDLAFLTHLKGDPAHADLLAAADDLRKNGAHSDYAMAISTKSLILLVKALDSSSNEERK